LRSGKKRWMATLPAQPTALAFDDSGQLLVSGHADTTALIWDVSGHAQKKGKTLDADGWDAVVKDLREDDAMKASASACRGSPARATRASTARGVSRIFASAHPSRAIAWTAATPSTRLPTRATACRCLPATTT
jgi:hypothetical protein